MQQIQTRSHVRLALWALHLRSPTAALADALKRTEDGAGRSQSSAALHVLCHFEFSFLFDMMTMDLFFWFLVLRIPNTLLLVERAAQTALMSCTSVNSWPMFQAQELRERVKFCIRRDGCSYTFAPVLILSHLYITSSHK